MNEILERVNELNEVLNDGYGVPNMEWVKTKVVELQNVVKENCTISDVINRRELLVAFNKEMSELHSWFLPAEDSMIDEFLSNQ